MLKLRPYEGFLEKKPLCKTLKNKSLIPFDILSSDKSTESCTFMSYTKSFT